MHTSPIVGTSLGNKFKATFTPFLEDEVSFETEAGRAMDERFELLTKIDYFKASKTNNRSALYDILSRTETATSAPSWEYQMIDDFNHILSTCSTEEREYESSPFIISLKEFLEKYGLAGFHLVKTYIISLASSFNIYLISEIMEALGDIHSPISYNERRIFLENNLKSSFPEIRYGAVLGLSNMNAKEAINSLEESLADEGNPTIVAVMQTVLRLLRK